MMTKWYTFRLKGGLLLNCYKHVIQESPIKELPSTASRSVIIAPINIPVSEPAEDMPEALSTTNIAEYPPIIRSEELTDQIKEAYFKSVDVLKGEQLSVSIAS